MSKQPDTDKTPPCEVCGMPATNAVRDFSSFADHDDGSGAALTNEPGEAHFYCDLHKPA